MALGDGVLYGLVGEAEAPDPVARWRMTGHGWPWDRISAGYNRNEYGWGFARTLLAFDPATKKVLWHYQADPAMDSRGVCLKGGRIYVSHFGKYVVCLDAKTGTEIWRRSAEKDKELFEALGPYRPGHGWVPGWKSTVYLKCTDAALYFVGPQTSWLSALSAKDGSFLWKQTVKDLQAVIRDDGLYTIGAERTSGQTRRLDLLTGEVLATYPVSRRACTRATGSPDGILFRAYDGTTRLDLGAGQPRWIAPMRPSCHVGVVIAGGRLYWVPWTCDCNLQMFGVISLGPAGAFPFGRNAVEAERLEKGVVAPGGVAELPVGASDWPVYRANSARTAETPVAVPEKVSLLWQTPPRAGYEPTAPVAAGGLAFVGGSDGIVCALDAKTGQVRWKAYTGGAERFPPAIAGSLALVGSGDGWAYAFEAASGRLVWRFRGAPAERRIPVFGALLSTWPASAPVVVEKGVAYVAAGLNCFDGTHVYALEAATGKIVWQNNTSGHLDADSRTGVAVQGETLLHDGKLYLAGGNAASPGVYDTADGRCLTPPPQGIYSRAPRGRELRLDKGGVAVAGQPFYSQRDCPVYDKAVEWPEQRVTAKNAALLFLQEKGGGKPAWRLAARDRAAGTELWAQPLPAEPVRWGLAVDAAGRIIVTLTNGQVLCYGAAQ
jgi:outer membrane protein assembly factor BamB